MSTKAGIQISSFAAPTEADIALFNGLSDEDKRAVVIAHLEKSRASGISDRSMDDLWKEALSRVGQMRGHGL